MATGTQYRGWTIIKNSDGYIALDPKGSNCIPGGGCHETQKDAMKSVDNYILADGDPQLFHLLWGQAGWSLYAESRGVTQADSSFSRTIARRDNDKYEPTYEFYHTASVPAQDTPNTKAGCISLLSSVDLKNLTPEAALALANVLRLVAVDALRLKKKI